MVAQVHGAARREGGPAVSGEALLRWRRGLLRQGGEPSALDWLLDLEGGVGWQQLQQVRLHPDAMVGLKAPLEHLEALWQRHCSQREPLQYLVGQCPWRDLNLAVAPGVLIPRQETELLVDLALERWGRTGGPQGPRHWADLGTGSGCLAVALARAWPKGQGSAVDQSPDALRQASANLQAHGCGERVELLQGDWWQPLRQRWGSLELVVANPPYIPQQVWRDLDPVVRDHEPALALVGGEDGLEALRAIAAGAQEALAPGGWLLLEHHHDQSDAVAVLLREAGLLQVQAHPDLEGKLRFASAQAAPRP